MYLGWKENQKIDIRIIPKIIDISTSTKFSITAIYL